MSRTSSHVLLLWCLSAHNPFLSLSFSLCCLGRRGRHRAHARVLFESWQQELTYPSKSKASLNQKRFDCFALRCIRLHSFRPAEPQRAQARVECRIALRPNTTHPHSEHFASYARPILPPNSHPRVRTLIVCQPSSAHLCPAAPVAVSSRRAAEQRAWLEPFVSVCVSE